jgi:hypothetical protein
VTSEYEAQVVGSSCAVVFRHRILSNVFGCSDENALLIVASFKTMFQSLALDGCIDVIEGPR